MKSGIILKIIECILLQATVQYARSGHRLLMLSTGWVYSYLSGQKRYILIYNVNTGNIIATSPWYYRTRFWEY